VPHTQSSSSSPETADFAFNPCGEGSGWDNPVRLQEQAIAFANLPAQVITGGRTPCMASWSPLEQISIKRYGRTHKSEASILIILCAAITLQ
jgi:hypothetical protein